MTDPKDPKDAVDAGPRRVPCPSCRRPALYGPGNPWRPFCSERCRSADLGAWASERFRVPAEAPTDAPTEANPRDDVMPPGGH